MDFAGRPAGPIATFTPQHTPGHVLCCLCGVSISPNPSNMCVNCIRSQVDITEGLQKQVSILWCKECGRYLQPPKHWVRADLESKELLTFCIKRLKGLQKVKLVDAGFIWTEPHSRRLKVKLTIQAEVMNGAILQQTFVVEYVVEPHMCMDCTRANTNSNVWTACVQVRQHTGHKRTFFYLEQLILKYDVDQQCISIKDMYEGVDFFFSNRAHALKFIDFVQNHVPIRYRHDKQLVSHNEHASTYNYKYTFSTEIVPICRDDLVCLPPKAAAALGGFGPLALCTRVSNTLTLTDTQTLRSVQVDANTYWRYPYRPVMTSRQLVEFVVLDAEPVSASQNASRNSRFVLADVLVAKASDFGRNDRTFFVRTHLGHLLHPGDSALGYDMSTANTVDPELDAAVAKGLVIPDIILVRKSYEEKRRRRKARGEQRPWKLKRMAIELEEEPGTSGRGRDARNAPRHEQDLERFMQELEEDPEMRAKMALYRDPAYDPVAEAERRAAAMTDDEEGDVPEVPLEELLDDLAGLQLEEDEQPGAQQHAGNMQHPGTQY
ncbi:g420 [Coccomyxa elongata]